MGGAVYKITDKQQQMMNRVYELARKEIETPTPLPFTRPDNAPQWDDANLVEHAFHVAVSEMRKELILSDPAKVQELKEREDNAAKAWHTHEEEAKRLGVDFTIAAGPRVTTATGSVSRRKHRVADSRQADTPRRVKSNISGMMLSEGR